MKFRFADIIKYAFKANATDAFRMFWQSKILRRAVILLRPYGGGVVVLRNNTSDIVAFKQVFIWEEYRYPIKGEVKTILDCGANIGCSSRWFKYKFPQAKIVAIEPEVGNFTLLQKNTAGINDLSSIKKGLWSKTCNLAIDDTTVANWSFRLVETIATENVVEAISVSDILKQFSIDIIDILKMDVETAEKNIFEYGYELWLPKTRYLFIETHDFMDKGCSKAVMNAIYKYDFSLDTVGENLIFINNNLTEHASAPLS